MQAFYIIIIATLLSNNLHAVSKKVPSRDPFWPIGYAPPLPKSEEPIKKPEPVEAKPKPKPPPKPKPVTNDEWKMARKLLKITGYALSQRKTGGSSQNTSLVIINRKYYSTDDLVKITSNDILFIWRVGEIGNNTVDLMQESATRKPKKKEEDKKF